MIASGIVTAIEDARRQILVDRRTWGTPALAPPDRGPGCGRSGPGSSRSSIEDGTADAMIPSIGWR